MRVVLIGMRRSRGDQLRDMIGSAACSVVSAEDAPDVFQPAPADVRRLMNALAPSLVAFEVARSASDLTRQLKRSSQWLGSEREIALLIGHLSAAEAAAAAILMGQDVDAALGEWMEDATELLGFIESHSSKVLLVNARAALEAPADLGFQFEMRFDRKLFRDPPALSFQEDSIASIVVPAAQIFVDARPDVKERDAELMNVVTLHESAFSGVSVDRILRSTRALQEQIVSFSNDEHMKREAELSSDLKGRFQSASEELALAEQKLAEVEQELSGGGRRVRALEAYIKRLEGRLASQDSAFQQDWVKSQQEVERLQSAVDGMKATRWWRVGVPFRRLYDGLRRALAGKSGVCEQAERVRSDSLFNESWYLSHYGDAINGGIDAAEHFVRSGWKQQKSPGPQFDVVAYLEDNPDVAAAGANPFLHYIVNGRAEGRRIRRVEERSGYRKVGHGV